MIVDLNLLEAIEHEKKKRKRNKLKNPAANPRNIDKYRISPQQATEHLKYMRTYRDLSI